MKLTGYTPKEVDVFVDQFSALMRKEMTIACNLAAADFEASFQTVVADGESTFFTLDGLSTIVTQWSKAVTATLMPFLSKIFTDAGQRVATPLGDVSPIKTTTMLQSMENLVTSFSTDVWEQAKHQLVVGSHEGESIATLANRIENVAQIKAKKAHVIAQTSVIAAVNGGEWQQMMEAAKAFDMVTYKEWVSTHDSHTRPTHDAADGQRQPLAESFNIGGGLLQYPGDPAGPPEEVISCRCTTVFDVDVDEQITASQTSPETLSSSPAVDINGQNSAAVITAAFDEADHPRGRNGRFIKKGVGLPDIAFNALVDFKKGEQWKNLTTASKYEIVDSVSKLTLSQWSNLKNEDKHHYEKMIDSAVNEGIPGSATAQMHIDDLESVSFGGESDDDNIPNIFDPSDDGDNYASFFGDDDEDQLGEDPVSVTDAVKAMNTAYKNGEITHAQIAELSNMIVDGDGQAIMDQLDAFKNKNASSSDVTVTEYNYGDDDPFDEEDLAGEFAVDSQTQVENRIKGAMDNGDIPASVGSELLDALALAEITPEEAHQKFKDALNTSTPAATPSLTTGSSTPIKITHGLIHAKHAPGTVIAMSSDDDGYNITWNGTAYDITDNSGEQVAGPIKKSKLYALLNSTGWKDTKWHSKGKQETEVTHSAPLDAAPPANPIPHPVSVAPIPVASTSPVIGTKPAFKHVADTGQDVYSTNGTLKLSKAPSGAILVSHKKSDGTWGDPHLPAPNEVGASLKWKTKSTSTAPTPESIFQDIASGNLTQAHHDILNSPAAGLFPTSSSTSSPSTPSVAKVHDLTGWKKIGGQTGSNKGAMYEAPDGQKFYVKSLKSKNHVNNEVLAAALYHATGINVPEVRHGKNHPEGWTNVIVSPIVPNAMSAKSKLSTDTSFKNIVRDGYAVDAWLSNHDVVGMGFDNIVSADGKPWRIDMGGSLLYRAQGGKKTGWGPDPTAELLGLKNSGTNAQAASVFGGMTTLEEKESAKRLLGITDAQIDQMVKDSGMPSSLADTLKARRKAILDKYGLDDQNNDTPVDVTPVAVPTSSPIATSVPASSATLPFGTQDEVIDSLAKIYQEDSTFFGSFAEYKALKQSVKDGDLFVAKMNISSWNTKHGNTPVVMMTAVDDDNGGDDLLDNLDPTLAQIIKNGGWEGSGITSGSLINAVDSLDQETWDSLAFKEQNQIEDAVTNIGSVYALDMINKFKKNGTPLLTTPPSTSTSTPVAPTAASTTVSLADIPSHKKHIFYGAFKAEKVSPAWSGAKIYASIHAAKAKYAGDPQLASLSDSDMLKLIDEIHKQQKGGTGSPYRTKVIAWLKTPNGQKAFKELNPAIATPPSSIAKKVSAKKVAPSVSIVPKKSKIELIGHVDTSVDTQLIYNTFKSGGVGATSGTSVKHDAPHIYANAKKQADAFGVSIASVIHAVDVETQKKYGSVTTTYNMKLQNWLDSPTGNKIANEIDQGTWAPAVKAAKKAVGGDSGTGQYPANSPLEDKVPHAQGYNDIPPFDPNTPSSDFPVISTSQAASQWAAMQSAHGNMTTTQQSALRYYTTNPGYAAMNSYLRGKTGASAKLHKQVADAQAGMKPTTKAIILHRGSGWFTSGSTGQQWTSYENIKKLEGGDFHNESFFSASVGGHAAFGGSIKFEIECPVGTPMAYVKAFSKYGGENEMLLAANLNFKIMSVQQKDPNGYGKQVIVRLRVMAPEGAA